MIKNYSIKKMATIVNLNENENFGADVVGQISVDLVKQSVQKRVARLLVDFDIPEEYSNEKDHQIFLVIPFRYGSIKTTQDVTIKIHKITKPWLNGDVTWNNYTKNTEWATPGGDFQICPSYKTTVHKFNYEHITDNLVIDLKDYVDDEPESRKGLLIRFDGDGEDGEDVIGFLKYYSPFTQYIFKPYVALYVDDFQYQQQEQETQNPNPEENGGDGFLQGGEGQEEQTQEQEEGLYKLLELNQSFYLNILDFNGLYRGNQNILFRLNLFPKHTKRVFGNMVYKEKKYILPKQNNSLFYSIIDISQPERKVVVPFDQKYTRVSFSEDNGMYFKLDLDNLQVNRTYKIQFSYKTDKQKIIIPTDYRFRLRP